jgi:hypothetical protein
MVLDERRPTQSLSVFFNIGREWKLTDGQQGAVLVDVGRNTLDKYDARPQPGATVAWSGPLRI